MPTTSRSALASAGFVGGLSMLLLVAPACRPTTAPVVETTPASPSTAAPPSLDRAITLVRAGDLIAAREALAALTAHDPENADAWLLRAQVEQILGDLDAALVGLDHAAALPDGRPRALLLRASVLASRDELDAAFASLTAARDTGEVDITGFASTPGLEALADDPRFVALLPDAATLDEPFVEPTRVLHQWRGEARGDQLGWIARNAGDLDGDGLADVITSAPTHATPGPAAGKVYAFSSTRADALWSRTGDPGAQLGFGLESAGDVDGDGVPDVIAGAPGKGQALVLSGADGAVLHTLQGRTEGDRFGQAVCGVGDADGDGHADLLVGAPQADGARGRAELWSGATGARASSLAGARQGDRFGSALDGRTRGPHDLELLIGAPDAGDEHRGRVLVFRGALATSASAPATAATERAPHPALVLEPEDTASEYGGMFLSIVGDVDGDGVPDLYSSDWSDGARGPATGRAYIHAGSDGHRLHTFTGEAAGDGFGIGVADAGDLDGDGRTELVIGAWRHASGAPAGGKVYLYRADGSLAASYTAKVMGESFGFDATGLGDIDGDGIGDLLLTSAWSPLRGPRTGRVFVLAGPDLRAR